MNSSEWRVGDRVMCVCSGAFRDRPDQSALIQNDRVYTISKISPPDMFSDSVRIRLRGVEHPGLNVIRFKWLSRKLIYPQRIRP